MHSTSLQLFTETYLSVCVDFVEYRQTSYNVNNLSDFAYQCRRLHHFERMFSEFNRCVSKLRYIDRQNKAE
jgi:hypothetical protein